MASDLDKYDVRFTSYPRDLFETRAEKYTKTWVMFNINVMSSSTTYGQGYQTVELSETEQARRRLEFGGTIRGGQNSAAMLGIGAGVTAFGAAMIHNVLRGNLTKQSVYQSIGQGIGVGALAGGSTAIASALGAGMNRETKRLATAIALPMPNDLNTGLSAHWGEDNTNLFAMLASGWDLEKAKDAALLKILGINAILQNGAISAGAGLAINPKKEMIFQGVGFRTIRFNYTFTPRNQQESDAIRDIVQTFKFHMMPEYRSQDRFTYIYPSEFDITFYVGEDENMYLFRIATCVLEDIAVSYTPDGLWATFDNGAPSSVSISMQFKELTTMSKEIINAGY